MYYKEKITMKELNKFSLLHLLFSIILRGNTISNDKITSQNLHRSDNGNSYFFFSPSNTKLFDSNQESKDFYNGTSSKTRHLRNILS